ncbi:hypothetical protein KAS41_02675 [Candidatus Parcubacteria bacterium]|nr:hypothetical protein [Candidatus Parcubacteria bacterium]
MRKAKKLKEMNNNISINLLSEYLEKSKRWLNKHDDNDDFFDKYLSLFIAVNIVYNLWAKIKNPDVNFDNGGDKKRFLEIRKDIIKIFSQEKFICHIDNLIRILDSNSLYLKVVEEKSKKDIKDALNDVDSFDNKDKKAEIIWQSFYVIRCNLIHGEKGYNNKQEELLKFVYPILKSCLEEVIKRLETLEKIFLNIKKGCIIKSIRNKEYLITKINHESIKFLRKHAKDSEKEYKISIEDLFNILNNFRAKENQINTLSVKKYAGGLQSPVIAIFMESGLINEQ